MADIAVLGYHGTAIFRALGKQVAGILSGGEVQSSVDAGRKQLGRVSHLKVLSLNVGVMKPCPFFQQAAS